MFYRRGIALLAFLGISFLPLLAAERVVISLDDGGKIEGDVLKKDDKILYLSIAGKIFEIARETIKEMRNAEGEKIAPQNIKKTDLYQIAELPARSTQSLSNEFGAAIVVVKTPAGLGTGWFCNPDGYVITNHHVISNEQAISITAFKQEGKRFEKKIFKNVKIVAMSDQLDLALLKIEEKIDIEIPQLYIGDSTKLKKGDKAITIGNPLGLERTVSQGIISTVNREFEGRLYIQTTAEINPGNSGGPLFNERGEVVGVTNMGAMFFQGLGFAIPSNYVKDFLDNVEAFAYDADNPNTGFKYMSAPLIASDKSIQFTASEFIKITPGISCLTLADINGDGIKEILFANNNKAEIGILRKRKPDEMAKKEIRDFEDINQISESERFKLVVIPVKSSISAMLVEDFNGDQKPDILIYGDLDGLSVLEQYPAKSLTFKAARKISDFKVAKRVDALALADFNNDGEKEIFALGGDGFAIIQKDGKRVEVPLSPSYRNAIVDYRIQDLNGDGKLDLLFFSADQSYAAHALIQNAEGKFIEEQKIAAHLSGPVKALNRGANGVYFLTLDKGKNRARELNFGLEKIAPSTNRLLPTVMAIPFDSAATLARNIEVLDLNGDGRPDIIAVDTAKNEFVVFMNGEKGFSQIRSPSPTKVSGFKLAKTTDNKIAIFCHSETDKFFGAGRVEMGKVSFPRPINVEGIVQELWLEKLDGGAEALFWIEKNNEKYMVKTTPADKLAAKAFDGQAGSLDVDAMALSFGEDEKNLSDKLPRKPTRFAFADFNGDAKTDIVAYWSFSDKESLYLGLGGGKFKEIIKDRKFLDEQKDQPLMVVDIDGDGKDEVLLIQKGFARVLKVDAKEKLYVEKQFNWKFDEISRLVAFSNEKGARRFVALAQNQAKIMEFDSKESVFKEIATMDLTGLETTDIKIADFDNDKKSDVLLSGNGVLQILLNREERFTLKSQVVFDARLDYFTYWNLRAMDLDGDGKDEALLFDSRKAMLEIHRPDKEGQFQLLCRQKLFEKGIWHRRENDAYEIPQELDAADVDGNGKPDLILLLQDRIAIYLQ